MERSRDWPDPRRPEWKIWDIQNASHRGLTRFRKFHLPAANWQRCEIPPLFSRAEVYVWRHMSVTWYDLKMRQVLESRVSYAKFQLSIYNAFWAVPEKKPSGRWHQPPPPSRPGRVNSLNHTAIRGKHKFPAQCRYQLSCKINKNSFNYN